MGAEFQFSAQETRVPKKKVRAKHVNMEKTPCQMKVCKKYLRAQWIVSIKNSTAKGLKVVF